MVMFFLVGLKPEGKNSGVRNLDGGLNRQASNLMEALFDEALLKAYPAIYGKIMETLPLDQKRLMVERLLDQSMAEHILII
jgi:hypothetical protein